VRATPPILRALGHPIRVQILALLLAESTSSPTDMATKFGADLGVVSYHVRRLEEWGLIKLVRTVVGRRNVKHLYSVAHVDVSDDQWAQVPEPFRRAVARVVVRELVSRGRASAARHDEPEAPQGADSMPLALGPGWDELSDDLIALFRILDGVLERG
jgi:DNA-binding transcriptional ArsR family regulator